MFVGLASAIGLALPRDLASSVAARSSQSSSWSFRYRMAFGKSFGRTVRRGVARSPHLPVCRTKGRRASRSQVIFQPVLFVGVLKSLRPEVPNAV